MAVQWKYEVKGEVRCNNKHIDEEVLYKEFVSSFNALVENKEHFIEKWKAEDGDELRNIGLGSLLRL